MWILEDGADQGFNGYDLVDDKDLPSTDVVDNEKLIETFLVVKKIEGLTDNTLRAYYYALKRFDSFAQDSFLRIDSNKIRLFLYEIGKTSSNVSVNNMLSNIRAFYNWLFLDGYLTENPCNKVKKIKLDKPIKEPLSVSEVVKIKDACENIREVALVDLLLSTGVRCDELTKIKVSECDFVNRKILIHGKGKKERIVYMDENCHQHLKEFLDSRTYDNEYLFCTVVSPHRQISTDAIESTVKAIGARCGIENCTIHRFRKFFATNLYNRGCDLLYIQNLLGHSDINTTTLYVRTSTNQIHNEFQKYM